MCLVCPNCGYCPHCRRGGYYKDPYAYPPYYPPYPQHYPFWYGGNVFENTQTIPASSEPITTTTTYAPDQQAFRNVLNACHKDDIQNKVGKK